MQTNAKQKDRIGFRIGALLLCFAATTVAMSQFGTGIDIFWGGGLSALAIPPMWLVLKACEALKHRGLRIFYYLILGYTLLRLVGAFWSPDKVFDTWQIYDMSRYVFDDFGYMQMIRQHIEFTHYEMAFPPLMPVLMALVNGIANIGMMASVYICYIASLLLVWLLIRIGNSFEQPIVVAAIAGVLFFGAYMPLMTGGNTQCLGFVFLSALLLIYAKKEFAVGDVFLCAVISALGLMNRFDFLAVAGVAMMAIPFLYRPQGTKSKLKIAVAWGGAIVTFVVLISPWILYSVIHFGSVFVTDNGRRLFNIPDTRPTTYFPDTAPAPTVRDNFGQWCIALAERMAQSFFGGVKMTLQTFIPLLLVWQGYLVVFEPKKITQKNSHQRGNLVMILESMLKNKSKLAMVLTFLGLEALVVLTGYSEIRYHLPFVAFVQYCLSVPLLREKRKLANLKKAIVGGLIVVQCITIVRAAPLRFVQSIKNGTGCSETLRLTSEEQEMSDWLQLQGCETLLLGRGETDIDVPHFAALCSVESVFAPSNLSSENASDFVKEFHVNFAYISDEVSVEALSSQKLLTGTQFKNLYQVEAENELR